MVVTVYDENTPVDAGVAVITFPPTKKLMTNSFGQVEYENIPVAKYDIYAFVNSYGSGKAITSVKSDEITAVDVNLIAGRLIEPSVAITSPVSGTGFGENEEITFTGIVSDSNTKNYALSYEWKSNIDGALANSTLENDGNTTVSTRYINQVGTLYSTFCHQRIRNCVKRLNTYKYIGATCIAIIFYRK